MTLQWKFIDLSVANLKETNSHLCSHYQFSISHHLWVKVQSHLLSTLGFEVTEFLHVTLCPDGSVSF